MHEKAKHDLSDIADLILSMQHDLQLKQQEQLMHLDIVDSSLKQRLEALWDTNEHELQQVLENDNIQSANVELLLDPWPCGSTDEIYAIRCRIHLNVTASNLF